MTDQPPYSPDPVGTQRVMGVSRKMDDYNALLVWFTEPVTDDQLRALHDYLREWMP